MLKNPRFKAHSALIGLVVASLLVLSGNALSRDSATRDEGVWRATLSNSLQIVIVKNKMAPVATTMVNYMAGSNEDPEGAPGTAHAQEHMLFRGGPGLSGAQLANIIAEMDGNFNAETQQNVTRYFFTVPSEDLDIALRIEAIRMSGIFDSEESWKSEREAIKQEVTQDLSDPEFSFYMQLLAGMFKGTPYANSGLGTINSFDSISGSMLKKFYDTWYAPNNAILVIVGNIDPEQTFKKVKLYFGSIPAKKLPPKPPINLLPVESRKLQLKTDAPDGLVVVSFRMPGYNSDDYAAGEVLADILSNPRCPLFDLVIDGKALQTGFDLITMPEAGIGYAGAVFARGSNPDSLGEELKKILKKQVDEGFPADLVDAAKRNKLTRVELRKNSVNGLASAWSEALAVQRRASPNEVIRAIEQVMVSDVNRVARKYLIFDQSIEAVLLPEASGKTITKKRLGSVESFAPKEQEQVTLPEWTEKALRKLSVPKSEITPAIDVLPHGLRVITYYTNESDTVCVYGHVKNNPDMEIPHGKEGLERILDGLFSYGTRTMDRVSFQRALDEIGAIESAGTDFILKVLDGHFDRGMGLLADNLLRPAFPERAFKTLQRQASATVAGELESPDYLAERALKSSLFPSGDPSLREATPMTFASLYLEDVRKYYEKIFRPDMTTIVIIGKISRERAREVTLKYFGGWRAQGVKPDVYLPPVPPNQPSISVVPDSSRIQDKVVLAETIGVTRTHSDYYALQLGNHVLGGAFYATRLYRDLREANGLVYHVLPSIDAGKNRASFSVEYACDPENVSKARAIIEYHLRNMQNNPVSADELKRAKPC